MVGVSRAETEGRGETEDGTDFAGTRGGGKNMGLSGGRKRGTEDSEGEGAWGGPNGKGEGGGGK